MGRVVVLRLNGNYKDGIQVAFEWGQDNKDGRLVEGRILSRLESNPRIPELYQNWQKSYRNLEALYRNPRLEWEPSYSTSREECDNFASDLRKEINEWLNSTNSTFNRIRYNLAAELARHEDIRVLIQTENLELRRLPWHLWDFWHNNDSIEIAISPLESKIIRQQSPRKKVRILAIFGDSTGIDLESDQQILNNLTDVELINLETPTRSKLEKELLDEQGWDIIFFAGHSNSERNGQAGRLRINKNEEDSLVISKNKNENELNSLLEKAIKNGLKLAIFNSCDGIGLANALSSLHIPQIIVMREPVPDEVASEFLKFFIEEFSQGKSLQNSVSLARARLRDLEKTLDKEKRLPYASWLPVIFQNPIVQPWTWPQLQPEKKEFFRWGLAAGALAVAVIGFGIYQMVKPKTCPLVFNDFLSCGEEILNQSSNYRFKQLGVNSFAAGNYEQAIVFLLKSWNAESKDPETLVYLNNSLLEALKAKEHEIKYETIAVAVPIIENEDGTIKNAALAQELLRGVAQAQIQKNRDFFDKIYQIIQEDIHPNEINVITEILDEFINSLPKALPKEQGTNAIGLKVVIADDSSDEKEAKKKAKQISKQSDILGVVGHYASEMTQAGLENYDNDLVLISPGTTTEELTHNPRQNFSRVLFTTKLEAKLLAEYMLNNGQKKVVIFYNPESSFTHSLWWEFKQIFQKGGGTIVEIDEFDLSKSSSNFNEEKAIEEVQITGKETTILLVPDGLVSDAQKNAIDLIKANNGHNWIVGTWTIYSPNTLEIRELKPFERLVALAPWHRHLNKEFSQEAEKLWEGQINSRTALAYDATLTLIKALESQEKPTRKGTQEVLTDPNFKVCGATGEIQFNRPDNGDRQNPPKVFIHVVPSENKYGKKFVPLEEHDPIKCIN